jgi:hypothetical protein
VVPGRGDDSHDHRPAFGRFSDIDELHAVGFGIELLPVGDELFVVDELVVVADGEAELFLGARDLGRRRRGGPVRRDRDDEEKRGQTESGKEMKAGFCVHVLALLEDLKECYISEDERGCQTLRFPVSQLIAKPGFVRGATHHQTPGISLNGTAFW